MGASWLAPSDTKTGPFNLTGTLSGGGASVTGTYAAFDCNEAIAGTFTITRQ